MAQIQITPAMQQAAYLLSYWMGYVMRRISASDPDFQAVQKIDTELAQYKDPASVNLENNWPELAQAAKRAEEHAVTTKAAAAAALAMQAIVGEADQHSAAHFFARAVELASKSVPMNEREQAHDGAWGHVGSMLCLDRAQLNTPNDVMS